MGYQLEDQEGVPSAIRRIVLEEIDSVLQRLQPNTRDIDDAIHKARVCFKKVRALLRLVRGAISADLYREENLWFRDAGRRLSAVRDRTVLMDTIDMLAEEFGDKLTPKACAALRKVLVRVADERMSDKKKVVADVATGIRAAQHRVIEWRIESGGFSALSPGLERMYTAGHDAMKTAAKHRNAENFHEWRKHVKYLWYGMQVLAPVWPKMQKRVARELERLADYLSERHDLALLQERVLEVRDEGTDRPELDTLNQLIDRHCMRLEVQALRLGERIYAEKPKAFVRRYRVWWRAWRREGREKVV